MSGVINLASRRPPSELEQALSVLEAMRSPERMLPPNVDELAAYARGHDAAESAFRRRFQLAATKLGLSPEITATLLEAMRS